MGKRKILFASFLLLCSGIWAREVTDTLESKTRDRVFVTYGITQKNGQVEIRFINAKKQLGRTFRDKYKKLDEVVVLFFDRMGNYGDGTKFEGVSPQPFMIPAGVSYKMSDDGYFLLNDKPQLSWELKSADSAELKIPMYLAHYEGKPGKYRYNIFSGCGNLLIKVYKNNQMVNPSSPSSSPVNPIISVTEIEDYDADALVAISLMNRITALLAEQEEYPFTDELNQARQSLREISYRPIDSKLLSKINEVLDECNKREKELKAEADSAAEVAARLAEEQAKQEAERERARQDSIAAVAQEQAEEARKQNLWLIAGGVFLAILAFIGNQTLQHYRNMKNQKNIMEMQQNMAKQAEDEARRRARNMAQSQMNRVQGEAKRKARNGMNAGIGKTGKNVKGNKGITI